LSLNDILEAVELLTVLSVDGSLLVGVVSTAAIMDFKVASETESIALIF